MTRERQLGDGGEDAHAIVGAGGGGRQHERRLREVRPVREALHRLGVEALGSQNDRDGVARERRFGEDVDFDERAGCHPSHCACTSAQRVSDS